MPSLLDPTSLLGSPTQAAPAGQITTGLLAADPAAQSDVAAALAMLGGAQGGGTATQGSGTQAQAFDASKFQPAETDEEKVTRLMRERAAASFAEQLGRGREGGSDR
jgi:hypothetical protein